MRLFRSESSYPKVDAQTNLEGRTYYVCENSLRGHKSRILECHIVDNGLLLAIVESVALDPDNRKRGYRPVIFDIFGTVISRVNLDQCHGSSKAAQKAMWAALNAIDAKAHTMAAIDAQEKAYLRECADMRVKVAALDVRKAA